ncbi:MAG: hypothetical protein IPO88_08570 [Nannocystis sp.]|uniref:hypothetical protein n=1 Tax=Nannocystis sp. TaxID=1962667 RepID=UPI0024249B7D|nr:hypothetical protein [Nannocystis sp.]MBK9753546.1 hypothetical protein [Nannocystis sp.]
MSRSPLSLSCALLGGVTLTACLNPGGTDLSTTAGSTGASDSASDTGTPTTGDTTGEPPIDEPPPAQEWPTLDCDPLVPSYCAFPFPSNVFTAADAASPTGRRLALSDTLIPDGRKNASGPPDVWNKADGFSPGLAMMAHLPGATITGLPDPLHIADSLAGDSPTVLIDAATGERVPHYAELDASHADDARRTFVIRPVIRLKDATRYIVAIRGVVDAAGEPLAPSPAFQALRDLQPLSDEPSVDARRPLYADIFKRLDKIGVGRGDLQLAWDFTTASREHNTAGMLKMRDEGLAMVGPDGPAFEITKLTADPSPEIALIVEGMMTVPSYLDQPDQPAHLVLGKDGLPTQNGTAEFVFTVVIPASARMAPAAALQYGHGLLGSGGEEIQYDYRVAFANQYNYALFAVDWIGMAESDYLHIAGLVDAGRLNDFVTVVDRGQQGILNSLLAMRLVTGGLAKHPDLQAKNGPMIKSDERYYHGNSQGGIFGTTYMALTTDVERGMLGVPGMPYSLLLNRSKDFDEFFVLLKNAFPDPIDLQLVLGLYQMMWDRTEPAGYAPYVRTDNLPGTPAHEVLLEVAIGDHQVSTLGAHVLARTIGGVPNLAPSNRTIWGLDELMGPLQGSAMIEYDFGLAPEPTQNIPPDDGEDPHGKVRKLASAQKSLDQFLRTGTIESFCDGPCDPE